MNPSIKSFNQASLWITPASMTHVQTPAKRLIVCADDFGMNTAINAGIIALAQAHRLSAVSCLTLAPGFIQDAPRLRGLDIDLGVHINFTEALTTPLSEQSQVATGIYRSLPTLIMASYLHSLNRRQVRAHIERQLDAFEAALGRAPDFVDGHQHVHQFPQIRTALCQLLAQRYAEHRPWLRCTRPGRLVGLPRWVRYKAWGIGVLGARACVRIAQATGLRTTRRLLGVYDFSGGVQTYEALLQIWLRNAEQGDVLMCHPALPEDNGDPMAAQRGAEYHVLSQPTWPMWLAREGVQIGRYVSWEG